MEHEYRDFITCEWSIIVMCRNKREGDQRSKLSPILLIEMLSSYSLKCLVWVLLILVLEITILLLLFLFIYYVTKVDRGMWDDECWPTWWWCCLLTDAWWGGDIWWADAVGEFCEWRIFVSVMWLKYVADAASV